MMRRLQRGITSLSAMPAKPITKHLWGEDVGAMFRKIIALLLALPYLSALAVPVAGAGQAVILTDAELDRIYAGGLNLGFDRSLGNPGAFLTASHGNGTNALKDKPIALLTNTGKLQFFHVNAPKGPNAPTSPAIPDAPPNAPDQINIPAVPGVPNTPNPPDVTALPDIPETPTSTHTPDIPGVPDPVFSLSTPDAPNSATPPNTPTAPNIPLPPAPVVTDAFVSRDGKFGIVAYESMGSPQNTGYSAADVNLLNVSETAQQYLSAINNVNAAGSTILIQQNLVVLINSNIQNLNNVNDLNFGNFVPLQ